MQVLVAGLGVRGAATGRKTMCRTASAAAGRLWLTPCVVPCGSLPARSVAWLNCRVVLVALSLLHGFVDCVEDARLSELVEQAGAPSHLDHGLAGVCDYEVDSC